MTDRPFQRPGSQPAPSTESHVDPGVEYRAEHPPTSTGGAGRGPARIRSFVACGVAGLVVGAVGAGAPATVYFADPEPFPVTLDLFPENLVGLQREDLAAREAGAIDAIKVYEKEMDDERYGFRIAYGGDGATVDYGQRFSLTIVNGRQPLPLPSYDVSKPALFITLQNDSVSCVFQPQVGLYDSAVLNAPADLTASGRTDCVLNDTHRNLSLRITSRVPADATQTATEFAGVLERTHAGLID